MALAGGRTDPRDTDPLRQLGTCRYLSGPGSCPSLPLGTAGQRSTCSVFLMALAAGDSLTGHPVRVPSVDVVGVHAVDAPEPCHLVELFVRSSEGRFDLSQFTQRDDIRPPSDWQVPYAETLLDPSGSRVEWDSWDGPVDEALWRGELRMVFFFHYLDPAQPC